MPQQQPAENHELSHALYEELEALKIRIAFAEISEDEIDEFEKELASVSELDYSENAQKRTLREIQRRLNKRVRKRFMRKTLSQTLNVISVVLLLFFLGLTTATATVRPVRLKLMQFIAQIDQQYSSTSLGFNDNDSAVAPQEWNGEYYPFYIPGEFLLTSVDSLFNSACYAAENDRVLEFNEFKDMVYENVDVNDEGYFDIYINGNDGIAMVDEGQVTIAWGMEGTYFSLYFSGDLDEAERIAESVQRVH